ncbi:Aste57867_18205 [Aphanomyces stellatus]|uniref:Aste57867_18205 protein n=1 Tax=Aphanomyces stellatus TaxID=120398 RepID=A0A485L9U4_9STRA|nr:hypothetical protein As57867_018143 [Aphanomyces stellatus]VFT94943.1 Aste57867_18205 [Aphanomyces stellatus]
MMDSIRWRNVTKSTALGHRHTSSYSTDSALFVCGWWTRNQRGVTGTRHELAWESSRCHRIQWILGGETSPLSSTPFDGFKCGGGDFIRTGEEARDFKKFKRIMRDADLSEGDGATTRFNTCDGKVHVKHVMVGSLKQIVFVDAEDVVCLNASENALRDMKTDAPLRSLRHLTLSRNWLSHMSDVRHFARLVQLDLSHNNIRQVDGIECLTHLHILNLSHNDLRTFLAVRALSLSQSIRILHLHHNVVATLNGYRARISSLLPDAIMLDDIRYPRAATMKKLATPTCPACGAAGLPSHVVPLAKHPLSKDEQTLSDALRSKPRKPSKSIAVKSRRPDTESSLDEKIKRAIRDCHDRQKQAKTQKHSRHKSLIERKLVELISAKETYAATIMPEEQVPPMEEDQEDDGNQGEVDALTSIENSNDSKVPRPSLDDESNQARHTDGALDEAWASCAALDRLFDTSMPLDDDEIIALAQAAADELPFQNVHMGNVLRQFAHVLSMQPPTPSWTHGTTNHLASEAAKVSELAHLFDGTRK